ncbi:hypothetical protein BXY85_1617 [Roseivirga pacifica]|uniref:Uncharacterized protein n=1 Tax=Roseivirga pacifica TaxID=1267423 RepID=A0A1I0MRY3_9BACT|nr:hypothetical protein [Roseivirga pacifica]RKQ50601.1 hypothetical protein BXY85_1617 [Roseivirga pacifica]SEV90627.1 hypothetical protein SAMN05216290_0601 [Roseivirga pacifica]
MESKNIGLSGTGNSPEHQLLIADLVTFLNNRLANNKRYKNIVATPETPYSGKVPDLLIWNRRKGIDSTSIIIEICWDSELEKDKAKVLNLISNNLGIVEAFVITFDTLQCYKVWRKKDGKVSRFQRRTTITSLNSDFSKIL